MDQVEMTFLLLAMVVNVIGSSTKRSNMLRDQQIDEIATTLEDGKLVNEEGAHLEKALKRARKLVGVTFYLVSQTLLSFLFNQICTPKNCNGWNC